MPRLSCPKCTKNVVLDEDQAQFRLRPRARIDIAGIWGFSADHWSETQADRYIRGLNEAFNTIVEFPKASRERSEFSPPIRIKHYSSHVIAYRIEPEWIDILRILHARSNWSAILSGD